MDRFFRTAVLMLALLTRIDPTLAMDAPPSAAALLQAYEDTERTDAPDEAARILELETILKESLRLEAPDSYDEDEALAATEYRVDEDIQDPHLHWYLTSLKASRDKQQDAGFFFNTTPDCDYAGACVADGHGPTGHVIASRVIHRLPRAAIAQLMAPIDVSTSVEPPSTHAKLTQAFTTVDRDLIKRDTFGVPLLPSSQKIIDNGGAAAVLALLNIRRSELTVAHTGDCRALLYDYATDQATWLTHDHRPDDPEDKKRIESCGGIVSQAPGDPYFRIAKRPSSLDLNASSSDLNSYSTLNMARAFGDAQLKKYGLAIEPSTIVCQIPASKQLLILCSDGICEAPETIPREDSARTIASLVREGLEAHSNPANYLVSTRPYYDFDNATAVVAVINPQL